MEGIGTTEGAIDEGRDEDVGESELEAGHGWVCVGIDAKTGR